MFHFKPIQANQSKSNESLSHPVNNNTGGKDEYRHNDVRPTQSSKNQSSLSDEMIEVNMGKVYETVVTLANEENATEENSEPHAQRIQLLEEIVYCEYFIKKPVNTCSSFVKGILFSCYKMLSALYQKQAPNRPDALTDALDLLLAAVELDSHDVTVWQQLYKVAMELKRYALAFKAIQSALQINPHHWPSLERGIILTWALLQFEDCIPLCVRALRLDSEYGIAKYCLQQILFYQSTLQCMLPQDLKNRFQSNNDQLMSDTDKQWRDLLDMSNIDVHMAEETNTKPSTDNAAEDQDNKLADTLALCRELDLANQSAINSARKTRRCSAIDQTNEFDVFAAKKKRIFSSKNVKQCLEMLLPYYFKNEVNSYIMERDAQWQETFPAPEINLDDSSYLEVFAQTEQGLLNGKEMELMSDLLQKWKSLGVVNLHSAVNDFLKAGFTSNFSWATVERPSLLSILRYHFLSASWTHPSDDDVSDADRLYIAHILLMWFELELEFVENCATSEEELSTENQTELLHMWFGKPMNGTTNKESIPYHFLCQESLDEIVDTNSKYMYLWHCLELWKSSPSSTVNNYGSSNPKKFEIRLLLFTTLWAKLRQCLPSVLKNYLEIITCLLEEEDVLYTVLRQHCQRCRVIKSEMIANMSESLVDFNDANKVKRAASCQKLKEAFDNQQFDFVYETTRELILSWHLRQIPLRDKKSYKFTYAVFDEILYLLLAAKHSPTCPSTLMLDFSICLENILHELQSFNSALPSNAKDNQQLIQLSLVQMIMHIVNLAMQWSSTLERTFFKDLSKPLLMHWMQLMQLTATACLQLTPTYYLWKPSHMIFTARLLKWFEEAHLETRQTQMDSESFEHFIIMDELEFPLSLGYLHLCHSYLTAIHSSPNTIVELSEDAIGCSAMNGALLIEIIEQSSAWLLPESELKTFKEGIDSTRTWSLSTDSSFHSLVDFDDIRYLLEQAVFCLSGLKRKQNYHEILVHTTQNISLSWSIAEVIYRYFSLKNLPEFDSLKNMSISTEMYQFLLRALDCLPVKILENALPMSTVEEYINHQTKPANYLPPEQWCSHVFYLIADYHFKNGAFEESVPYYKQDLRLNPCRLDTWASLGLVYSHHLDSVLNFTEPSTEELPEEKVRQCINCFTLALFLDEENITLQIELGNLFYSIVSYANRYISKAPSRLMNISLEHLRQCQLWLESDLLSKAEYYYRRVLHSSEGKEERWLCHYMIGKVSEKRGPQAVTTLRVLDQYLLAMSALHEMGAKYPKKIVFYNKLPPRAVEVIEVFYKIQSLLLKRLLTWPTQTAEPTEDIFAIEKSLLDLRQSPFVQFTAKAAGSSSNNSANYPINIGSSTPFTMVMGNKRRLNIADVVEEKQMRLLASASNAESPSAVDDAFILDYYNCLVDALIIHNGSEAPSLSHLVTACRERCLFLCLNGLEIVLQRLPLHYKAMYHLAHLYTDWPTVADKNKAYIYMYGPNQKSGKGANTVGLFKDRRSNNFFYGVWRIPVGDLDRCGNFAHHMYRSVRLLLRLLYDTNDWRALCLMDLRLRKSSSQDQRGFLSEADRLDLCQTAFCQAQLALHNWLNEILTRQAQLQQSSSNPMHNRLMHEFGSPGSSSSSHAAESLVTLTQMHLICGMCKRAQKLNQFSDILADLLKQAAKLVSLPSYTLAREGYSTIDDMPTLTILKMFEKMEKN